MSGYNQAFSDHCYLWQTYAPAADMTGGYVDQEDLAALLSAPTKATATRCLESQIRYWFQAGPEGNQIDWNDATVQEIAERYGCRQHNPHNTGATG